MYNVTRLLEVAEADRQRIITDLRSAAAGSDALRWVVQPTLAGVRNGGDILVHLRFAAEEHWRRAAHAFAAVEADQVITRVNGVEYTGQPERGSVAAGTVYRVLLLRVSPDTDSAVIAEFEDELSLMPRYVSAISAWQLSRVMHATGASDWTHVFEQEFTNVEGLMGAYLNHPIHWAVVDRWFDPEMPDVIVRDRVCHSFCEINDAVLD